jgi:hypothetical protein
MLTPGPLLFLAYKALISYDMVDPLNLFFAKKDLANMIAGFSYTRLGFLATVIAILFVFTKSANFEAYRRIGYLDIFFCGYLLSIICLLITAFLSLFGFSPNNNVWPFHLLLMSFANNLIQIFLITWIICNIARKSSIE